MKSVKLIGVDIDYIVLYTIRYRLVYNAVF